MKWILLIVLSCLLHLNLDAQKDVTFRYADIHTLDERMTYSIFYPILPEDYRGVVILVHDQQLLNPKSYGGLIESMLSQNLIVIYPSFASFIANDNRKNVFYIEKSIEKAARDMGEHIELLENLPVVILGHGKGGVIAFEIPLDEDAILLNNVKGIISIAPTESPYHRINNLQLNRVDEDIHYVILDEEDSKGYKNNTGKTIYQKIEDSPNSYYFLHQEDEHNQAKRSGLKSYYSRFSSTNNGYRDYFSRFRAKPNDEDIGFYYPFVKNAIECSIEGNGCENINPTAARKIEVIDDVDINKERK